MTAPFFPEPQSPDETVPEWDETAVSWLGRSTALRARAVREFLNRSLAQFPAGYAKATAKRLRQNWQAYFFELIVGRYLQVLGASVEPERLGTNGTRVDFTATFPDGIVSVECVSKEFNPEGRGKLARQSRMGAVLDEIDRAGWLLDVAELPDASTVEEFRPYVVAIDSWLASLSETPLQERHHFEWTGNRGIVVLDAVRWPSAKTTLHAGPSVGFADDSVVRLRKAMISSQKRKQARGAVQPCFLAVDCPFAGPDVEDFDQALFGQTVAYIGRGAHSVGHSFLANGTLVADKTVPFAGVIAFLGMRMTGAADPVVYLNPHQSWPLPAGLAGHEQRLWTSKIEGRPATRPPLIGRVGFVDYAQGASA